MTLQQTNMADDGQDEVMLVSSVCCSSSLSAVVCFLIGYHSVQRDSSEYVPPNPHAHIWISYCKYLTCLRYLILNWVSLFIL